MAEAAKPLGEMPGALPVAWEVVQRLREQVSDDLEDIKKKHQAAKSSALSAADERQAAQAAVHERVAAAAAEHVAQPGREPWTPEQVKALRKAVLDALFLAGPIQQVLEWPGVEDVVIDRRMVVDFTDRPRQEFTSPFTDEEAKIDWVNQMCARSGHRAGQLSPSRPMGRLRSAGRISRFCDAAVAERRNGGAAPAPGGEGEPAGAGGLGHARWGPGQLPGCRGQGTVQHPGRR
ncbi:hypothetical protein ACQEU8_18875 [Streptomyces sp. CA-250714]|uniref:hypothetical protein n=1 Tax=Streptomyces sp. CA-250714 TaxID=3240060 RepID=UPI003D8A0819